MFFEQLMKIAAFEMIPTDIIYAYISETEGEPLSPTFEELGFDHHLIMENFGTLGFIAALIPFLYLLNSCVEKNRCDKKCCRKFTKWLNRKLYWGLALRMIIESYVIGFICGLLNILSLELSLDSDKWTLGNDIFSLIFFPLLCLFPLFGICFMLRNFKSLDDR